MTFAIAPHPVRALPQGSDAGPSFLSRLRRRLGAALPRRRRTLTGVPDHVLRDIGLTRAEIEHLDL